MKVAATRVMSERGRFGLLEASNAKTKKSHPDDAKDNLRLLSQDHKSTQFGDLIDPKDGVNTIIVIFSKPLLITRVHIYFERATTNPQISSPLLPLLRSRLHSTAHHSTVLSSLPVSVNRRAILGYATIGLNHTADQ
jgi:hypothetical protein